MKPFRMEGYDDVTGEHIKFELSKRAGFEDMSGFRDVEVYGCISREEAPRDPVGAVIGVRWVDHNKRTRVQPEVRN